MLVKRNDGARRCGVGELVQDQGGHVSTRIRAHQFLDDQLVHSMIGLVQPIAAHGRRCLLQRGQMGLDVGGSQRHHFLEHFAALLAEGLVARVRVAVLAAVEKAEVVADAVGELGGQLGAQHFPLVGRGGAVGPLDNHRRADIAKDEMAITVAPFVVARGDLRVDHQHALGAAGTHGVDGLLDGKGGR